MTRADDGNVKSILSEFGGDPQRAEGLAKFLGFEPISNPADQLTGALSGGLKQFLRGRGDRRLRCKRALPRRKLQGGSRGGRPVGRRTLRVGIPLL